MKFYAITTSERASKGQGGNKFIRVNFSLGDTKKNIEVMSIVFDQNGIFTIRDRNHNVYAVIEVENLLLVDKKGKSQKGKSQKGETIKPIALNSKKYNELRKQDEGNW